jgi:uncharacterized coiled-coil protein SlyX
MRNLMAIVLVLFTFAGCQPQSSRDALENRVAKLEKHLATAEETIATLSLSVDRLSNRMDQGSAQQVSQAATPIPHARELALVNTNDTARATLATDKNESWLSLVDETGELRIWLLANKGGSVLTLRDENGKGRVQLDMDNDGRLGLMLYDEFDLRVWLDANLDPPQLKLYSANGKRFYVASDVSHVQLGVDKDGPGLLLHDATGKIRVRLRVNKDSKPGLRLLDVKGKVIWSTP